MEREWGEIPPRSSTASATPPNGRLVYVTARNARGPHTAGRILLSWVLGWLTVWGAAAQDTGPTPSFSLIGDVGQTVYETVPDWGQAPAASWNFTTDLKPKFTYGPVVFLADTTWDIPLTASLSPSNIQATVYEAYFRITPVENLDLTVGQKHYNIGVGQVITVGDSINPVNGFFDQKTGFRGFTAEWSPNSAASFSGALSTENSDLTGAGQASLLLDKLQLTASLVADGQKARTFNPAVGVSYDLFTVILTAEGAAEFLPQGVVPSSGLPSTWSAPSAWSSPALSGSAGARWTVTIGDWDYTLSGQYLRWGQGWTKDQEDGWNSAIGSPNPAVRYQAALVRPAFPVLNLDNAIFQASAVDGTTWNLSALEVVDLEDQSVIGQATAAWDPWDNLEFALSFLVAGGDSGTTYQYLPPDPLLNITGLSRYQVSFSTTYHF